MSKLYRYAFYCSDGWTILEAPLGVQIGKGDIIQQGLSEEEMQQALNFPHKVMIGSKELKRLRRRIFYAKQEEIRD